MNWLTSSVPGMGLVLLSFDPVLADIARDHSEDMGLQHYFAHMNPAGQNPTARGTAAGYSCRKNYGSYYTNGIAENLFLNNLYSSVTYYSNRETVYHWNTPEAIAQITVAGWMNSSGHRENILARPLTAKVSGLRLHLKRCISPKIFADRILSSPYARVYRDIEPDRFPFTDCDCFWQIRATVNALMSDINTIRPGF